MAENIKYINADELYINLDIMKNPDTEFATDDYIDGFSDDISAVIKELEIMPATDVAEVVRCKDCKYAQYWYGNDKLGNETFLCYFLAEEGIKMFADDFCSRGERKENDNEQN